MNAPLVRGWCPGARRPMRSGDGLILRLRMTGGRLASATAHAIADMATRYGNGELDLGRRGGLQLRGIRDDDFAVVEAGLAALGLLDEDVSAEAIRNVTASPLSDLDETAEGDAFALATQLETALIAGDSYRALPGKFGFSVDDGGRFGLAEVPADVRLRFVQDGVAVSLDGDVWTTKVQSEEAVAVALRLAHVFLDLAPSHDPPSRRMAALVARIGAEAIFAAAGLIPESITPVRRFGAAQLIGAFPSHIGVGLPFGRLNARQLHLLADIAQSGIRLTPFRAILLPGVPADVLPRLAKADLVTSPDEPLLAVVACSGAPACGSASVETRELARRLATLKPAAQGIWLHVSGCEKSCASSNAHAVTLVGRDGGLDLVLDGRPIDPPHRTGLSPEAVEALFRSGTVKKMSHDYIRDGAEIYRRSFAIIRAEADLARFAPEEEKVAVRVIHAAGMVEVAADLAFGPGAVAAAKAALEAGAPVICDSRMVANGITRARLPASNDVICTLDDPSVPTLALTIGNTRTAAAMMLWGDRLKGAVVAIGNAPTALFHLFEMLDAGAPRPAAVIGMPVGFVGAAESKEALIAWGRVPYIVVRGRKGGSAMAAATVNALASDRE
ncbi:MAG: hypothetical protein H6R00_3067 [Proteobacteria bacterium]|nr:hypothetical protein [Pseudomonadota bacterium]